MNKEEIIAFIQGLEYHIERIREDLNRFLKEVEKEHDDRDN